jgi:hypothetical protein
MNAIVAWLDNPTGYVSPIASTPVDTVGRESTQVEWSAHADGGSESIAVASLTENVGPVSPVRAAKVES